MKETIITAALAVFSTVMLVVAGAGILFRDNTPPVLTLEGKNNLTYTEGDTYDDLLENMTAEDDKDGDVTDSIRVSKIYQTSDDRAVVIYVAKDTSNNIGKLKREIRYEEKKEEVKEEPVQEEETEDVPEVQTAAPTAEPDTAGETEPEGENTQTAAVPKVTMVTNAATLKVGEAFNVLRYVQSAVDVDGTSLSRYIHAEGAYDMNQPGTYSIRVYATSPSGAVSNIETFTLTVEP